MILGLIFLGTFPSINVLEFLGVILTSIFATVISILIVGAIGMLSFYIEDVNPIYWIYSKLILVFGTIFPVEFFPGIIQTFLRYSPVYVVSYAPAKLFVNYSTSGLIEVLISQGIYMIILFLLTHFIYRKGVRKLNVNGG
jgi:ABC-2 type transport system permease protein